MSGRKRVKSVGYDVWITRAPGRSSMVHMWYRGADGVVKAICDDQAWPSRWRNASRAKTREACLPCREMYVDDGVTGRRIRLVVQDRNPFIWGLEKE